MQRRIRIVEKTSAAEEEPGSRRTKVDKKKLGAGEEQRWQTRTWVAKKNLSAGDWVLKENINAEEQLVL
jgi:hypothetical protein